MILPTNAEILLQAFGLTFDPPITVDELLAVPARSDRRDQNRARAMKALRDEQNPDGSHRYTFQQIGDWFGVRRHSVHAAIKMLDRPTPGA